MRSGVLRLAEGLPELSASRVAQRKVGRVRASVGLGIEVDGLDLSIGSFVEVETQSGVLPAQAVGFRGGATFLMPLGPVSGLQAGAEVRANRRIGGVDPDDALGRVINARGEPMDEGAALRPASITSGEPINPLTRPPIETPFDLGVRSLNALLTVGRGQRVGLFAGSGVGKSVLLGMLARFSQADVVVVGLIGERGREVQEFIRDNLGDALAKCVVVASPADDAPALRLRGAWLATELAEAYRARGSNVLLLMDSLTRCAQAQREIGLALGEPGTTKGYPPSSFSVLPQLVERAGTTDTGTVTAFYTVLMEEDDLQDPIVDAARAILDGHIVLERDMADQGIFPAVAVSGSVSRVMPRVSTQEEVELAREFKAIWSKYAQQQDLIHMGAYQAGSDPHTDRAIALHERQIEFLRQGEHEQVNLAQARQQLMALLQPAAPAAAVPTPMADGA